MSWTSLDLINRREREDEEHEMFTRQRGSDLPGQKMGR